jgi:outer membrane protein assembly factor BamB
MAVIELGLVNSGGDEPAPGAEPRPMRRADRRRLLAAVVAICCVLTVTGSARPEPQGPVELWTAPFAPEADTFRLAGDSVYVLSRAGGSRLTARDARTGRERWTTTDIESSAWLNVIQAGVLMLPAGTVAVSHEESDGTVSTRDFNRDTVAIDTATGRSLWHRRGEVSATFGNSDQVLLTEWNETGERAEGLKVIRVRDGSTVWSRTRGDLEFWMTDTTAGADPERLVTVNAQGMVEVLSLADGGVVTTGRIPWTARPKEDEYSSVNVQGQRLFVDQTVRNTSSVSVYDLDTLRPLWHVEQATPGGSYLCGPVVCLSDAEGTSGYEPETGKLRWRLPGAGSGAPLPDGRLMIESLGSARRTLVDAMTGRLLADLGTAMPVWDTLGRTTPYLIADTTDPPDRSSVSSFHPATGEVLLRGTIAPVLDYGCQHEGGLLACVTQNNQLAVTDVG